LIDPAANLTVHAMLGKGPRHHLISKRQAGAPWAWQAVSRTRERSLTSALKRRSNVAA
jgi:hypothetical protein